MRNTDYQPLTRNVVILKINTFQTITPRFIGENTTNSAIFQYVNACVKKNRFQIISCKIFQQFSVTVLIVLNPLKRVVWCIGRQ